MAGNESGLVGDQREFKSNTKPNIKVYPVEPYESSAINGLPHSPHKIQGMFKSIDFSNLFCLAVWAS